MFTNQHITMEDFKEKLNHLLDKIFKFIVGLILFGIVLLLIGLTISLVIEVLGYIAFHLNYIVILGVVIILSFLFFEFDFKDKGIKGIDFKDDYGALKTRNILTIIGLVVIGIALSFGGFFRIYNDGNYCAEVDVFGNSSGFYNLNVEVEDGCVNSIHWNNGGWLDETHFDVSDAVVDNEGIAYFTDDRGRDFVVKLKKRGSCR